jgi:hypothetical protein
VHDFAFFAVVISANSLPLNLGIMGGISLSYMDGSEIDGLESYYQSTADPVTTGNCAIHFGYSLLKWCEIQSGLFISGHGYEMLISNKSGIDWSSSMPLVVEVSLYAERKIVLMEFPLLLRLKTPYFSRLKFRIYGFGGIMCGFVFSAFENLIEEIVTYYPLEERTTREKVSSVNLFESRVISDSSGNQIHYSYNDYHRRGSSSLMAGFGMEKRFNYIGVFIQGQFVYGLKNFNRLSDKAKREIVDSLGILVYEEQEAYFRSFQISTGFTFYFGGS